MARKRTEHPPLVVLPGWGGWAQLKWRQGTPGEVIAYARFEADAAALLHPVELRVVEPWLRRHRELPLGRVENAVNADARVRWDLLHDIEKEMPDNDPATFFLHKGAIEKGMSDRIKLKRPIGRKLGDDFYRAVADAYTDALAFGLNPRKTLALDSATPADTVARWIRQARQRGYLSSGEPGKASGVLLENKEA
jgi:hypothetical protein